MKIGVKLLDSISFTVFGEPVAQGRPRATTINGHVRMYDPQKSRDFKKYVKFVGAEHAPERLLEGAIALEVKVFKPTLKSFSKKKKLAAESGHLRPVTKPDVDNYVKGVKDGLKQVIWIDDSQVVDLRVSKFYSVKPRVEISITPLESQQDQLQI